MKRVASVAVKAGDRLLIGKRSDDHRFNLPGGHVDEGESPEQGAARELREETGIDVDPSRLVRLCEPRQIVTFTGKRMEVHSYLLVLPDVRDTKREGTDPGEAHDWSWVNVSNGLPPDIAMNWHNKKDSTLEAIGLNIAAAPLGDKPSKVALFEYGTLMHKQQPPKTETSWRTATIRGDICDVGPYKGLTNIGTSDNLVIGEIGMVSLEELGDIDKRENVAAGEYSRVKAVTTDGTEVYVYEYNDKNLEKAWPKEYNRVKGQDSDKGVASKKQYRYMAAIAAEGDSVGKDYVKNSPKKGEGLPESGTGGARGARGKGKNEGKGSDRAEKGEDLSELIDEHKRLVHVLESPSHEDDKKEAKRQQKELDEYKDKAKKANEEDDIRSEAIKRMHRPKVQSFQEHVAAIKRRHAEKPQPSLAEQVKAVKDKYKTKIAKSTDLFFGKLEGLLDKGFANEQLLSHIMDVELLARSNNDEASLEALYKSADVLFDGTMSPEEQVVHELSYMAREGDEVALLTLEKFVVEMHDELIKSMSIEDVVADAVMKSLDKSNYGPKNIDGEKVNLYNPVDNINRKATRTGVQHDNIGRNRSEQRYTPSAHGTFAQQADREAKRDKQKSKQNPVKVYTEEEKLAFAAAREKTNKSEDNSRVVGKKNGHSVRKVHGYYRYTSGPKRGEYVHRHEAEKRLGRKLGSKEHVDHKNGSRGSTKNTKVMSAAAHAAKTNKTRAGKGYSGSKRYEHSRD